MDVLRLCVVLAVFFGAGFFWGWRVYRIDPHERRMRTLWLRVRPKYAKGPHDMLPRLVSKEHTAFTFRPDGGFALPGDVVHEVLVLESYDGVEEKTTGLRKWPSPGRYV